jgi:hypothetical protein
MEGEQPKKYLSSVGKRVEVRYRTGYVYHSASGTLAADDGTSIFIEDDFVQDGRKKMMRVEIPYEYILSLAEISSESNSN